MTTSAFIDDGVKKQRRTKTTVLLLAVIAAFGFLLWNMTAIRPDARASILPGPLWMLRFEALPKFLGWNVFAFKTVAVLITATLVTGIFAVAFCRRRFCVAFSIVCLVLWLSSGLVMQNVIAFVSPLDPIEDQPGLPRVLLIGDSISIGYTLQVRDRLAGQANVHRVAMNCGSTAKALQLIDSWLGEGDWAIVHFNWGLHDLRKVKRKGTASLEAQVPLSAYEQNLNVLVNRLKQTNAKLIWATTTPILQSCRGHEPEDVVRYNRVAAQVMEQHDVLVNDLFEFASSRLPELQRRNDIHFTVDGYRQLAEQVVAAIDRVVATD